MTTISEYYRISVTENCVHIKTQFSGRKLDINFLIYISVGSVVNIISLDMDRDT